MPFRIPVSRFHHPFPGPEMIRLYTGQNNQSLVTLLNSKIVEVGRQLNAAAQTGEREILAHTDGFAVARINPILDGAVYSYWGAYNVPHMSSKYHTTYNIAKGNPDLCPLGKMSLYTLVKEAQEPSYRKPQSDGMLLALSGMIPVIRSVAATRIPAFKESKYVEISGFPNEGPAADTLAGYLHKDDFTLPQGLSRQDLDHLSQVSEKLKLTVLRRLVDKKREGITERIQELPLSVPLYTMLRNGELTDKVLLVKDVPIKYHGAVVAAKCHAHSDNFPEKADVSPRAAREFFKFCYDRLWRIPEDWPEELINEVMTLADQFRLGFLRKILQDELDFRNTVKW